MIGDVNIFQVLIVVVLIESVVETVKPLYDKEKGWNTDALIALGISILICVGAGLDLFAMAKAPLMFPYVGAALTGVIASRGSNVIHDLIKKLNLIASGGGSASPVTGMTAGLKSISASSVAPTTPAPPTPGHGGEDPTKD